MAKCHKCGFDPDEVKCEFCGAIEHARVLGNFGGVLKTICCQTDPTKPLKAKGVK